MNIKNKKIMCYKLEQAVCLSGGIVITREL